MSPLDYCANLKTYEFHGVILTRASVTTSRDLGEWIRPRVRRSDFVGVHKGVVTIVAQNVRLVKHLDVIAVRLISEAKRTDFMALAGLRFGVSSFISGRDLFEERWLDAQVALESASDREPYVLAGERQGFATRTRSTHTAKSSIAPLE